MNQKNLQASILQYFLTKGDIISYRSGILSTDVQSIMTELLQDGIVETVAINGAYFHNAWKLKASHAYLEKLLLL